MFQTPPESAAVMTAFTCHEPHVEALQSGSRLNGFIHFKVGTCEFKILDSKKNRVMEEIYRVRRATQVNTKSAHIYFPYVLYTLIQKQARSYKIALP